MDRRLQLGACLLATLLSATITTGQGSDVLEFESIGIGLPDRGQWRNGFDVADMNGDGALDIVHGPPRAGDGRPAVFLGDGAGGFKRWAAARFPDLPYDYGDAAAADFDGDGSMDLALAIHLRGLVALRGDGDGAFRGWRDGLALADPSVGSSGRPFSSRAVHADDWNGDGRPDLIALGEGPDRSGLSSPDAGMDSSYGLRVWLNLPPPSSRWLSAIRSASAKPPFGDSLAVADLNGDGLLDLATGSQIYGRRDIVNLGREDGSWAAVEVDALPRRGYVSAVAAADRDGDGKYELAVSSLRLQAGDWMGRIDLLSWQPDGTFARQPVAELGRQGGFTSLVWGDLNGDSASDLVAAHASGAVWVFIGDESGGLTRATAPLLESAGEGCKGYHVRLADLDSDGRDEIIAAFAGEPSALGNGLLGAASQFGCASGGSIRAWRLRRAP